MTYEELELNGKKLWVIDDAVSRDVIEGLHDHCLDSQYLPGSPSRHSPEHNLKMVCYISPQEFQSSALMEVVQKVSDISKNDFRVSASYINYYGPMHRTVRHCDAFAPDLWTILFFPNSFWEEEWGGEIKFHNEQSKAHYVFNCVPGRIMLFDGRIEHTVLPLTMYAKRDRFSIAVKGSFDIKAPSAGATIDFKYKREEQ